jgi:hypothetical protein
MGLRWACVWSAIILKEREPVLGLELFWRAQMGRPKLLDTNRQRSSFESSCDMKWYIFVTYEIVASFFECAPFLCWPTKLL